MPRAVGGQEPDYDDAAGVRTQHVYHARPVDAAYDFQRSHFVERGRRRGDQVIVESVARSLTNADADNWIDPISWTPYSP
jgi:hypothetical protein